MKISLIPLSITFLYLKILGFLFPTCKIVGNLLDNPRKVYMNGTLEILSPPQVIEFTSPSRCFTENIRRLAPVLPQGHNLP